MVRSHNNELQRLQPTAPAVVPSSGIALSLVAESPGALAVVPLAEVRDSVKVLRIDGHLPNEAAYPIQ